MLPTLFLGEPPFDFAGRLERRRALDQDGHDEATLHGEIDWPPA
ncbi:MAG: hypothetical protein ACT4RN_16655 [Pseudonocardia sp.]